MDLESKTRLESRSAAAEEGEPEPEKHASGHSRGNSFPGNPILYTYNIEDIERLTKEVLDDTIADTLLNQFTDWIHQDVKNFNTAKRYIRELGVDQDYDTSRIANESLRKLVENAKDLRPKYEPPIPEDREAAVDMMDMLKESAISPPKKQLHSIPSSRMSLRSPLFTSLRKKSSHLFTRSPGLKEEAPTKLPKVETPMKSPQSEALMFESQLTSLIAPALRARAASTRIGSSPVVKKKLSISTSLANSTRSRSQEYPPNTPDRPAPLNIKSRTAPAVHPAPYRLVSTPVRTQYVSPLPPMGESPLPPVTPFSSPLRIAPRPSPRYHLFPQQYFKQRKPVTNADPFSDMYEDDTAPTGSGTTTPSKVTDDIAADADESFDSLGNYKLKEHELTSLYSSSVYSDTHIPKQYDPINNYDGVESRQDSITGKRRIPLASKHASYTCSSDTSWHTEAEQGTGQEDSNRNSRPQDELELLGTNSNLREQREDPIGDFLLSLRNRPLPLRSYENQASPGMKEGNFGNVMQSGFPTVSHSHNSTPFQPIPAPLDSVSVSSGRVILGIIGTYEGEKEVGEDNESDTTAAAEEGEDLVVSLGRLETAESAVFDLSRFPAVPTSYGKPGLAEFLDTIRESGTHCSTLLHETLRQSRTRGARLSLVDLDTLNKYSIAWRDDNEELLKAMYGRKDVELSAADVKEVNGVARELREMGRAEGYEWVREVFRGVE